MNPTIILDAGHGGTDSGATYNGRLEKEDTLRLALAVGDILEQNGFPVIYTRTTDVYDTPIEKARIANNSDGDYFVSIHRNSSPQANMYHGVETLLYDNSGIKAELARAVNQELERVGFRNAGIKERPNLVVLKRTEMPAILIEAGFLNTDSDNDLFDTNFDQIAEAIASAIIRTLSSQSMGQNRYRVQVGLFRIPSNAQYYLNRLLDQGFDGNIYYNGTYYVVTAGDTSSLEEAKQLSDHLRSLGYDTLIVQNQGMV